MTNESGNVKQRYEYDAFGAVAVLDKNGDPVTDLPKTNYLFTGREYQPESGLYNYRNRFFHPGLGRFVQADPIGFLGADANLYSYVWNNPGNWTDPSGEFAIAAPVVIGIVLAYVVWQSFEWTKKYPVQWPHIFRAEKEKDPCEKGRGGETEEAKKGREEHGRYNPGPTYEKEVRLPSGKRADAVDFKNRVVRELKPNKPEAIRKGERQVEEYRRELEEWRGGKWTGVVDTYGQ